MVCSDCSLNDRDKNRQLKSEIDKLRRHNASLFTDTDNFFKSLESPSLLDKNYSDDEKLCFAINYFNFRLLHQILSKESKIPKDYCEWRELVDRIRFVLFGYKEMPLFWLDQAVIR